MCIQPTVTKWCCFWAQWCWAFRRGNLNIFNAWFRISCWLSPFIFIFKAPFSKRLRLSALEELFEAEDRALKSRCADASSNVSIPTKLLQEIELYRKIPAIPTSEDPLVWWWDRRDMLPFLYQLSNSYLCIQASSTPHERAFSTEGDKLSQERSHVLPEQADLLIFLQKNC